VTRKAHAVAEQLGAYTTYPNARRSSPSTVTPHAWQRAVSVARLHQTWNSPARSGSILRQGLRVPFRHADLSQLRETLSHLGEIAVSQVG
jgi:hypothetical protein